MPIGSKWNYKSESYWSRNLKNCYADYTIIGGGIVGFSTAISLMEKSPNLKISILEKGSGCDGASVRNAGFVCFGSVSEIMDDIRLTDEATATNILKKRIRGIELLKERVELAEIDFQNCGGYEIFQNSKNFEENESNVSYLNSLMRSITATKETFRIKDHKKFGKVIWNKQEGSLDPAKMMQFLKQKAISLGIRIFYNVSVEKIDFENSTVNAPSCEISFKQLIICTNAWTKTLNLGLNVLPARNQVIITKPIDSLSLNGTFHMDKGYVYFRNVDERVLIGGARDLSKVKESTLEFHPQESLIVDRLLEILKNKILPNQAFQIEQMWTGIMGIGKDKLPLVGLYKPNVWIATKMGGMGVAIGSAIGEEITDMITGNLPAVKIES